ncbi:glycosyltransferase [Sedimentitalea sp. JM2-8]|uniref:Glycosyltransferase n=1 Tax=Sedimentitalea xiamensis TaxID=3050037 RepID=A0ABT7FHS0_9RHOB|nr:glycosyltransferase [Sedimentitalea xiamensis]MDK3074540.1 glycosyltransferase [Sedimentitalea xiamensis]
MATAVPSALKPSRTKPAAQDRPLSPQERYFLQQAEAIHRVYAPVYPDRRIHIILKALDRPQGDPDSIVVQPGTPDLSMIDASYLGTVQFGNDGADDDAAARAGTGTAPDAERDVTIVAGIPRQVRPGDMDSGKTAPDFRHRAVLGSLLWRAPVLFEQGKYHYEMRQKAQCAQKHSFSPIPRATSRPLGRLETKTRDTGKPPAILIGFHWLEMGGAEKLAFDCVKWARAAGFRVLVVAERADIHRHASKLPQDADVEFIRADAYLHPGNWFAFLEQLVLSENIRAIHIHHNVRLYDNLLRLKAAFPDLVMIDSTHIVEYENGGFPRTSGVWTNYIDHHHVISRDLVSFYLDRFGVSEKVLLGRMLDPVDPAAPEPTPAFRLSAGQKSCRIAFVGRMVHQKRAPLVVEIARRLQIWARAQGIGLQVDMVGTGAYLDVVRHMIRKANLSGTITLHPADADVPALLGQADILVLPSSNEGLALVCYEAIANGALPISTDVGGQDELVPESLLVAPPPLACVKDTVALIRRLMTEPAFLADCKTGTAAGYRALRADPTAQEVLTALYSDILRKADAT